jgi:hypothetical protein
MQIEGQYGNVIVLTEGYGACLAHASSPLFGPQNCHLATM